MSELLLEYTADVWNDPQGVRFQACCVAPLFNILREHHGNHDL